MVLNGYILVCKVVTTKPKQTMQFRFWVHNFIIKGMFMNYRGKMIE